MSKPAATLTLICAGTVVLFFLSWAALPKSGMEQLALILPWLLMLGAHVVLGPVALFLAVRARRHARHAWIYVYFVAFVGLQGAELVRINRLDQWAVERWNRVAHPEEHALADALWRASRQDQLGDPRDEGTHRALRGLATLVPRIEHTWGNRPSPLTLAAGLGYLDLVALMIERGAGVDGTPRDNDAPLLAAAGVGDTATARLLIDAGADPNRRDRQGRTALLIFIRDGKLDAVPWLLGAGADPNLGSGGENVRPLELAVTSGDPELVARLLEAGADPNAVSFAGENLGVIAADRGDVETFRRLQEAGLSLEYGDTPLDPNVNDRHGRPALIALAGHRTRDSGERDLLRAAGAARVLLRHGADANLRSEHGVTALAVAASRAGSRALCELMLEAGADVNARSGSDERTPLMSTARTGDPELIELLLAAGADVNVASVGLNRTTALVDAIRKGEIDPVVRLLDAGARVSPP